MFLWQQLHFTKLSNEQHAHRGRLHTVMDWRREVSSCSDTCRVEGQAAINPSHSRSTLEKQGLIKFSFRLLLSFPSYPVFFFRSYSRNKSSSVGLFGGWNNIMWLRGTLQKRFIAANCFLDWVFCVLEDFSVWFWTVERLETWNDTNAPWREDDREKKRRTPQSESDCIKALQERRRVHTEAMHLVFISFYFNDRREINLLVQGPQAESTRTEKKKNHSRSFFQRRLDQGRIGWKAESKFQKSFFAFNLLNMIEI